MDAADLFVLMPLLQVSLVLAQPVGFSWGETPSGYSPNAAPVPAGMIHGDAAKSPTVIYNLLFNQTSASTCRPSFIV